MSEIRKNDHRLMQVLLAPVISEKATLVAEKNEQVVFEVAPDANKQEVKAAWSATAGGGQALDLEISDVGETGSALRAAGARSHFAGLPA